MSHPLRLFKRIFPVITLTLVLMLSAIIQVAKAKDYKIEVIVFENLNQQVAHERYQYQEIEEITSDALAWQIEPGMLGEQLAALTKSPDYRVAYYYSWGQESLPISEAATVSFSEVDLSGWVRVYARQLLFANIDLDFNGYRMREKRRIKLDEQHYFDHPKFGILMQVSRLEPSEGQPEEALGEQLDDELSDNANNTLQNESIEQTRNYISNKPIIDDDSTEQLYAPIRSVLPQFDSLENEAIRPDSP